MRFRTLKLLLLLTFALPFLACGGPDIIRDLGDEVGGTETGNPPSCLTVVEDCDDLDEDGICDDSENTDDCGDDGLECDQFQDDGGTDTGNPENDGGTDTGNPENDDGETEEDSGTGCLKVTPEF